MNETRTYHITVNGYEEPVEYVTFDYPGADQETLDVAAQNYTGEYTLIVEKNWFDLLNLVYVDRQIYPTL